ncbi:hypothetical protein [Chryseobacterium sp.]|uniref:hypothetical protein n=1 Tax=Chryseobacterium sp. TaxID=1871047 RepID=UPI0025BEA66B|nr:hypothetical protein [Chryseobacterium sp.]
MRNIIIAACIFFVQSFFAQNIYLNKVEKVNDNKDKFFYKIEENREDALYLGELEVQGFSKDDASTFSMIYKKAKEIGANGFTWKPFETVDGKDIEFNPSNYRLNLYYISPEKLVIPTLQIYLFASSDKNQKISINNKDYSLSPRSYIELNATPEEVYTISTKKLLGSTIKLQMKANQASQYFQISSMKIKSNTYGEGGINLKSGDIIGLERSYAEFLSVIYQKQAF